MGSLENQYIKKKKKKYGNSYVKHSHSPKKTYKMPLSRVSQKSSCQALVWPSVCVSDKMVHPTRKKKN